MRLWKTTIVLVYSVQEYTESEFALLIFFILVPFIIMDGTTTYRSAPSDPRPSNAEHQLISNIKASYSAHTICSTFLSETMITLHGQNTAVATPCSPLRLTTIK
ncbi:hypothetical protein BJX76DRAFT_116103 [Aspergillus varians]